MSTPSVHPFPSGRKEKRKATKRKCVWGGWGVIAASFGIHPPNTPPNTRTHTMFRRCCPSLASSAVVRNAYAAAAQRKKIEVNGSKRNGAIRLPNNPMNRVRAGYVPPVAPPRFTGMRMRDGPATHNALPNLGSTLGNLADSFKKQDAENKRLREEAAAQQQQQGGEGATSDNGYPQPPPLRTPSSQETEEEEEEEGTSPQPRGDYRTLLAACAAKCATGGGGVPASSGSSSSRRGALIDDDDGEDDDIFWGSRGRADDASALVLRRRGRDGAAAAAAAATAQTAAAQAQARDADNDVDAPFFPSPTAHAQPRVGAAEAAALLAAGGARPARALEVLEDATEARCFLSDEALTVVLEAVAADLAGAGAAATQKERYAVGVTTLKRVEELCGRHEAGTRSASAMLLCAACAAVPSKAMRLFRQFAVEDKVRLSSVACNTYLRLLVAFDMLHEARDDAIAALQVGAAVDQDLYQRLLHTSKGKMVHSHQSTRRISRRMRMDTKTKWPHSVKTLT